MYSNIFIWARRIKRFHEDIIWAYWEKRFADSMIGTRGFVKDLKAYLSSGAGLDELCSIVCMEDKEGNPQYEKFINAVMDSKLHIKEKNTEDYLDIQRGEKQIFTAIRGFATAPALVFVGFLMVSSILKVDFNDLSEAVPAYLCMLAMPLAYSISEGIAIGVIFYVVINVCCKAKKVTPLMYVLAVLFICKYIFL